MNNKKNTPLSAEFWIIFIVICLVLGIVLIISYQIYSNRKTVVVEKKYKGADIVLDYASDTKLLTLTDLTQLTNAEGISGSDDKFFEFTVKIKKHEADQLDYEISVIRDSSSTIDDKNIRIYLEKMVNNSYKEVFQPNYYEGLDKQTKIGSKKDSMVVYSGTTASSVTEKYRLRLWLSNTSTVTTGTYAIDIAVNAVARG